MLSKANWSYTWVKTIEILHGKVVPQTLTCSIHRHGIPFVSRSTIAVQCNNIPKCQFNPYYNELLTVYLTTERTNILGQLLYILIPSEELSFTLCSGFDFGNIEDCTTTLAKRDLRIECYHQKIFQLRIVPCSYRLLQCRWSQHFSYLVSEQSSTFCSTLKFRVVARHHTRVSKEKIVAPEIC